MLFIFSFHGQAPGFLNALYDISDAIYLDAIIGTGPKGRDERDALYKMVDRFSDEHAPHTIFLADRGYSGYNSFAHVIEKGAYFVFRVKDVDVTRSILVNYDLPKEGEFDVKDARYLVKGKRNNIMKEQTEVYHYFHRNVQFDFIDPENSKLYYMPLRITRIKIDTDKYECLISNLPFSLTTEDLKELYRLRWGIETSFRELKYNIGMVRFHSRKLEYVLQEVFARMIMFNFCSEIVQNIAVPKGRKGKRKHVYAVDFSTGITVCREYLSPWSTLTPDDLVLLMSRCIHAVSPGRHYERNIRGQHYITLNNRMG